MLIELFFIENLKYQILTQVHQNIRKKVQSEIPLAINKNRLVSLNH